jgi:hypothetical protein
MSLALVAVMVLDLDWNYLSCSQVSGLVLMSKLKVECRSSLY